MMVDAPTVIISTYNNSEALEKTLWGFACQDHDNFDVIIADDGSTGAHVDRARRVSSDLNLRVTHLWHEDRGFRKAETLNKAILHAKGERLIFVDGDVIPRRDYVANHVKLLEPDYFITGGSHLHLPSDLQKNIKFQHVETDDLFTLDYLLGFDVDKRKFQLRLEKHGSKARFFDALFPRWRAFMGCNASCWREHAIAVNGFDESWGYGGTDMEFGKRLANFGVKSRRHSFSLIVLHQDHHRPYRNPEQVKQNKQALRSLAMSSKARVDDGLDKHSLSDIEILYST